MAEVAVVPRCWLLVVDFEDVGTIDAQFHNYTLFDLLTRENLVPRVAVSRTIFQIGDDGSFWLFVFHSDETLVDCDCDVKSENDCLGTQLSTWRNPP